MAVQISTFACVRVAWCQDCGEAVKWQRQQNYDIDKPSVYGTWGSGYAAIGFNSGDLFALAAVVLFKIVHPRSRISLLQNIQYICWSVTFYLVFIHVGSYTPARLEWYTSGCPIICWFARPVAQYPMIWCGGRDVVCRGLVTKTTRLYTNRLWGLCDGLSKKPNGWGWLQ